MEKKQDEGQEISKRQDLDSRMLQQTSHYLGKSEEEIEQEKVQGEDEVETKDIEAV